MPETVPHLSEHRSTRQKFDWDLLCNGDTWVMVRGIDFDQRADLFRDRLYPQQRRRGLRAETMVSTAEKLERDFPDTWSGLSQELRDAIGGTERELVVFRFVGDTNL